MTPPLPASWQPILSGETEQPYYQKLQQFLAEERKTTPSSHQSLMFSRRCS